MKIVHQVGEFGLSRIREDCCISLSDTNTEIQLHLQRVVESLCMVYCWVFQRNSQQRFKLTGPTHTNPSMYTSLSREKTCRGVSSCHIDSIVPGTRVYVDAPSCFHVERPHVAWRDVITASGGTQADDERNRGVGERVEELATVWVVIAHPKIDGVAICFHLNVFGRNQNNLSNFEHHFRHPDSNLRLKPKMGLLTKNVINDSMA